MAHSGSLPETDGSAWLAELARGSLIKGAAKKNQRLPTVAPADRDKFWAILRSMQEYDWYKQGLRGTFARDCQKTVGLTSSSLHWRSYS